MSEKPELNLNHYPDQGMPEPEEQQLNSILAKSVPEPAEHELLRRVRDRISRKLFWAKGRPDEEARGRSATATGAPVFQRLDYYEVQGWRRIYKQSQSGKRNRPSAMFDEALRSLIRSRPTETHPLVFWQLCISERTFRSGSHYIEISVWHRKGPQWLRGSSGGHEHDYLYWGTLAKPKRLSKDKIAFGSFRSKLSKLRHKRA